MGGKMKNTANYITISRIFISLTLLFFEPLGFWFSVSYVLCGLTDIFDGYVARKLNIQSELGSRLDSIADLVMTIIVLYMLFPVIELKQSTYIWILLIILVRSLSIVIVYLRYKTFAIMHTYSNKFTGLILFVTPLLLTFIDVDTMAFVLCLVGSLSACEELLIHLKEEKLDLDRKSIFETI